MTYRTAAPAFAAAIAMIVLGGLMSLFFLTDDSWAGGVIGLVFVAAGLVTALVGLYRLAVGIDYLTARQVEHEKAATPHQTPAEKHDELMARIRRAAAAAPPE